MDHNQLIDAIRQNSRKAMRIMEVCGTHTMSIARHGIRSLLPETISLISGPGCPVCVTTQGEIDACIALAGLPGMMVATFGDMIRIPGSVSSLQQERARGSEIHMIYSPMDALEMARQNPEKEIVLPGVGFETTAPAVAATILTANEWRLKNFSVLSLHKRIVPALHALMGLEDVRIDGFLLPGHVSAIIGAAAYEHFARTFAKPCVIAGFEAFDMFNGIWRLVRFHENGEHGLENGYPRVVTRDGNRKARHLMSSVFDTKDVEWRGIGLIPQSGLAIKKEFESFDAEKRFQIPRSVSNHKTLCECGDILTGKCSPPDCRLFGRPCTPENPIGPCMVSSEGACAAYYRYQPASFDSEEVSGPGRGENETNPSGSGQRRVIIPSAYRGFDPSRFQQPDFIPDERQRRY